MTSSIRSAEQPLLFLKSKRIAARMSSKDVQIDSVEFHVINWRTLRPWRTLTSMTLQLLLPAQLVFHAVFIFAVQILALDDLMLFVVTVVFAPALWVPIFFGWIRLHVRRHHGYKFLGIKNRNDAEDLNIPVTYKKYLTGILWLVVMSIVTTLLLIWSKNTILQEFLSDASTDTLSTYLHVGRLVDLTLAFAAGNYIWATLHVDGIGPTEASMSGT